VDVSVIQQAKIQAEVLVPLVKAMRAELDEARANALVRKALGDTYSRYGEAFRRAKNEKNVGTAVASAFATYARDDALIRLSSSQKTLMPSTSRDAGMQSLQGVGRSALGFLLVCSVDLTRRKDLAPT
jgi:hypothetical protein